MKKIYNKIQDALGSIPSDKHLHFEATSGIAFIVSKLDQVIFMRDPAVAATIGAITAFMVGLVKEVAIDFIWREEQFDGKDITANLTGAITGAVASLI